MVNVGVERQKTTFLSATLMFDFTTEEERVRFTTHRDRSHVLTTFLLRWL